MKRRDFTAQLTAATLGLPFLGTARAQGAPVEGTHYIKLSEPVPVPANGKISIVEFFWYGCPHCNAFEPTIEAWAKRVPADVDFHQAHVAFTAMHETHSRIYYTLETMNLLEQLHHKVFAAIHVQHRRLDKEPDIQAFVTENGADGAKFMQVFKSFAVQTKVRQAKQLSEAYKIDGVPTIGVQGRFWTSVALAQGPDRALAVTDYLAQRVRSGR